MIVRLESTTKRVVLNGNVEARIWEGHTESGIVVHAYITRIACREDADASQFEAELQECRAPSPDMAGIPMRLIL